MSALGKKQTFAMQQPMSALPPIATAKADIRERLCKRQLLICAEYVCGSSPTLNR